MPKNGLGPFLSQQLAILLRWEEARGYRVHANFLRCPLPCQKLREIVDPDLVLEEAS